jgi:hypothetical protein
MKNYCAFSLLGAIFLMIIHNELLKGLILFFIILFPFLIIFLIEWKDDTFNRKEFSEKLKFIINVSVNLSLIVFSTFMLSAVLLYKDLNQESLKYFMANSLYYSVLIFTFLIVNYFATKSKTLRASIMAFIKSINNFLNKKSLISILVIVFAIILKPVSKELLIGLIGSYLFFFLTEIDNFYKDNKADEKRYNKYDIFFQVIINVLLIINLADFEKIFNIIVYNKAINYDFWINVPTHIIFLALSIAISHCIETIISWGICILVWIRKNARKFRKQNK